MDKPISYHLSFVLVQPQKNQKVRNWIWPRLLFRRNHHSFAVHLVPHSFDEHRQCPRMPKAMSTGCKFKSSQYLQKTVAYINSQGGSSLVDLPRYINSWQNQSAATRSPSSWTQGHPRPPRCRPEQSLRRCPKTWLCHRPTAQTRSQTSATHNARLTRLLKRLRWWLRW